MTVQENFFHRVSDDPLRTRVCRQVALLWPSTGLLSFLSGSISSMSIDGYSERALTAENIACHGVGDVLAKGPHHSMFHALHPAPSC